MWVLEVGGTGFVEIVVVFVGDARGLVGFREDGSDAVGSLLA